MGWCENEFKNSQFKDHRLTKRLCYLSQKIMDNPGKSIPAIFQKWPETKAAYRFMNYIPLICNRH